MKVQFNCKERMYEMDVIPELGDYIVIDSKKYSVQLRTFDPDKDCMLLHVAPAAKSYSSSKVLFEGKDTLGDMVCGSLVEHPNGKTYIVLYHKLTPHWIEVDPVTVRQIKFLP